MKVVVDYYGSNEELLAKLMGGLGGYDVIMPSDYMVDIMARQGLLREVPADAVPNRKHLDARFMDLHFDKGNRYSFPYLWGLTGIAYDSDVVKPAPDSWQALWDPKHKGRIVMLNERRCAMTLLAWARTPIRDPRTRPPRSTQEQRPLVRAKAGEALSQQRPSSHSLVGGCGLAPAKPSIKFAVPKGAFLRWTLCVTKAAGRQGARLMLPARPGSR